MVMKIQKSLWKKVIKIMFQDCEIQKSSRKQSWHLISPIREIAKTLVYPSPSSPAAFQNQRSLASAQSGMPKLGPKYFTFEQSSMPVLLFLASLSDCRSFRIFWIFCLISEMCYGSGNQKRIIYQHHVPKIKINRAIFQKCFAKDPTSTSCFQFLSLMLLFNFKLSVTTFQLFNLAFSRASKGRISQL